MKRNIWIIPRAILTRKGRQLNIHVYRELYRFNQIFNCSFEYKNNILLVFNSRMSQLVKQMFNVFVDTYFDKCIMLVCSKAYTSLRFCLLCLYDYTYVNTYYINVILVAVIILSLDKCLLQKKISFCKWSYTDFVWQWTMGSNGNLLYLAT